MKHWISTVDDDFKTIVPNGVLKYLKIRPGDKIYWHITADKRVFVTAKPVLTGVTKKSHKVFSSRVSK